MKAQPTAYRDNREGLHFLARALGIVAMLTVLLYVRALISGGFLTVALNGDRFGAALVALLLLGALALLVAWRWERLGGLLAFVLGIPVAVYVATAADGYNLFSAFVYASPLIIAGGLYWLDARLRPAAR